MMPYSAIDYAAYQTRTLMDNGGSGAAAFTHSWLVPSTQDLCGTNFKPNHPQSQQILDPGILELRKEKSRDAARSRRGKENFEFYELAKMLPLPAAITSQLDKASIIRLTISYLKLRDFTGHGDPPWNRETSNASKILKSISANSARRTAASLAMELFEQHQGTHILQSLDGFALALAADGRFLYISETVSIYLGLSQVEMAGSSIFDYVHQGDHAEVAEQLGLSLTGHSQGMSSPSSSDEGSHGTMNPDVSSSMSVQSNNKYKGFERSFCIRMKSTLTKRGCQFKQSTGYRDVSNPKNANAKPNNGHYSVVLILCRLRPQYSFNHNKKSQPQLLGMVALAIALPPPSVHEIRLECDMFVTRINFDFRLAHCEPKITEVLGYSTDELVGESLYNLCHGEDAVKLRKCHSDLIEKGQVLTHYYRILNKNGGYTWIQTCATIVCNIKNNDEQNIICVNYVISARENTNVVMDQCQLEIIKREIHVPSPIDKDVKPLQDVKDDIPSVKIETPTPEIKAGASRKTTPEAKVEEPPTRGRKRKPKPDNQDTVKKQNLPPASTILSDSSSCKEQDPIKDRAEPSVRDLENAMSKHLPSPSSNHATDFSTNSLLKTQDKESSWNSASTFEQQQPPVMPASSLLKQLYANRESVIRAATRPSYVYSDGALPTPPGSEYPPSSNEGYPTNYPAVSYASNSVEYNNNNMTPPGSVSPRDLSSLGAKGVPNYDYNHYAPSNETTVLQLPLKPQPYAIHNYPDGQYFTHHPGFWYPTPT
ncbi:protein trachealess-like isoform X2 [Chironomus tepperi]|uniref:protein trachealess-like isoform X2 n=1 Tax=Chironomus tepperi TaxID=113505 RepID=UPI00391F0FC1